MVNWYQEIYQYSKHLSMMLEVEVENACLRFWVWSVVEVENAYLISNSLNKYWF